MKDVYYIPALRSNIISLGQATEVGCEVNLKDDTLKLLDRHGQLMVKTTRTKNRLYKVTLQVELIECMQLTAREETTIWHTRLGHVNKDTVGVKIGHDEINV